MPALAGRLRAAGHLRKGSVMSSPVTTRLTAHLIVGLDACLDFTLTASYDGHDPYAVRLGFPSRGPHADPGPSWTFGRQLIADGLHEATGDGDVHIWPCGFDLVMVELRSNAGSALIAVPARGLRTFLFMSYAEVPPGYESRHLQIDTLLHDLMGRA